MWLVARCYLLNASLFDVVARFYLWNTSLVDVGDGQILPVERTALSVGG